MFNKLAQVISRAVGHPWGFGLALLLVILWACSGPIFGFGDTWQLVINTTTTIITFLMVFLIQNTQNRDSEAMHLKLDELIRVNKGARKSLLDLEELSATELDRIKEKFEAMARKERQK